MISFSISFSIFFAFVLQLITAAPDSVSNGTGPYNSTGSTPIGNATLDQMRADLELRVQNMRGCDVAEVWMPSTMVECTEWCDLKDAGRNNILRYHVRLTGTGVNPDDWCETIHQAIDYHCGWSRPFFQCNYNAPDSRAVAEKGPPKAIGITRNNVDPLRSPISVDHTTNCSLVSVTRAPTDPDLGVYIINGWTKKVEYHDGINIRFDWWGWWEPRDAMHDCVASAIRMGTCRNVNFANGLHCIPVLYLEPKDGLEYHDQFVAPEGCHWASEVPKGSQ
ncbi:hypothetical protein DL769_006805 [Monosporascus sp. CRB-8-3]|nr:hypothetical protein DL769_006805 [Monosporascus sp. CRB-8-3]